MTNVDRRVMSFLLMQTYTYLEGVYMYIHMERYTCRCSLGMMRVNIKFGLGFRVNRNPNLYICDCIYTDAFRDCTHIHLGSGACSARAWQTSSHIYTYIHTNTCRYYTHTHTHTGLKGTFMSEDTDTYHS